MCIVSKFNFHLVFRKLLANLYSELLNNENERVIEDYIVHLVNKIPAPVAGIEINFSLRPNGDMLQCYQPKSIELPTLGIPLKLLFDCLSIGNIFKLFSAVLTEQRMLFVSSRYSLLTCIPELITSLIYPLTWQHTYAPILPELLIDFIYSPMPFIMGVNRAYLSENYFHDLTDVIIIDLDSDTIISPFNFVFPQLPDPFFSFLSSTLVGHLKSNILSADTSFQWENRKVKKKNLFLV